VQADPDEGDLRMVEKTEYEKLVESFESPKPPTAEDYKRFYEDRVNNQPPIGADGQGNIRTFPIINGKAQVPDDYFDFEIIGDDEDPADISDINDWDDRP